MAAIRPICRSRICWKERRWWSGSTTASRSSPNTGGRRASWCRTSISGSPPSGYGACASWRTTSQGSGRSTGTTAMVTRAENSGTTVTSGPYRLKQYQAQAASDRDFPAATTERPVVIREGHTTKAPRPAPWQPATVVSIREETHRVKTIRFAVSNWPGHLPGQHADVRLTAEDGYRAERSYSIASPPEVSALELTVDRLDDGEVSPFLTGQLDRK